MRTFAQLPPVSGVSKTILRLSHLLEKAIGLSIECPHKYDLLEKEHQTESAQGKAHEQTRGNQAQVPSLVPVVAQDKRHSSRRDL